MHYLFIFAGWEWDIDCSAAGEIFLNSKGNSWKFRTCKKYYFVQEGLYLEVLSVYFASFDEEYFFN